jgi:hypothetical protein
MPQSAMSLSSARANAVPLPDGLDGATLKTTWQASGAVMLAAITSPTALECIPVPCWCEAKRALLRFKPPRLQDVPASKCDRNGKSFVVHACVPGCGMGSSASLILTRNRARR